MALDVTSMLINLMDSINPIKRMVTGAAYIIGIAFALKALYSMKIYGELRTMMASQTSIKEPLTYMLCALMLIAIPTGIDVVNNTTFGTNVPILPYTQFPTGGSPLGEGGEALIDFIQVLGAIAFIRGWVLLARSAGQGAPQGTYGKGLTHIIGGILAINVVATAQAVVNTFGLQGISIG